MRRIYRRPKPVNPKERIRANHLINSPFVFLIDENGVSHGKIKTSQALAMAEEAGLDLVEVNPKAEAPIVKICDLGQFKYEKNKKLQKQKVSQKVVDIKCVRLSVRIGAHDLAFKLEQAKKFLNKGDKLRIEVVLKGREKAHQELGAAMLQKFFADLKQLEGLSLMVEEGLTRQGGKFTMLLTNKKA